MSSAARRGLIIFLAGFAVILAAFALVDQNGVPRHDSDFRGELMLVYFGYTYCPDACPTALQTMTTALDDLGDAAKGVQPIFVSVDPERDTVAQMKIWIDGGAACPQ